MTQQNPNGRQQNGNGQSTAIVPGPQARLNTLKSLLDKSKGSIAAILPKHLTPERLIKLATSAASRQPDLLECTPESILLAVVQAGTLGLEPSTPLHHCALVAINNGRTGKKEAALWIEYRGLCQLAYQSGEVLDIYAHTVYENDEFDFEYGTKKWIRHKYDIRKPRGAAIAYYAVVKFKTGGDDFVVLSKHEVEEIREASPGKKSEAWIRHFDRMGEKSAIRDVLRCAPMSQDKSQPLARALDHDSRFDRGASPYDENVIEALAEVVDPDTGEVISEPVKSRAESLKDRVAEKANAS